MRPQRGAVGSRVCPPPVIRAREWRLPHRANANRATPITLMTHRPAGTSTSAAGTDNSYTATKTAGAVPIGPGATAVLDDDRRQPVHASSVRPAPSRVHFRPRVEPAPGGGATSRHGLPLPQVVSPHDPTAERSRGNVAAGGRAGDDADAMAGDPAFVSVVDDHRRGPCPRSN